MMKPKEKLRKMSKPELKRVVRMLHDAMDRTSRSIAESNLRWCLRRETSVVFTKVNLLVAALQERCLEELDDELVKELGGLVGKRERSVGGVGSHAYRSSVEFRPHAA